MAVSNIPGYKYLVKHNSASYLVIVILIFALGTTISFINWHDVRTREYNTNISKYDEDLNASKSIVTNGLNQYSLLLDDGSSLLAVNSNNITQSQWLSFFQAYNLAYDYPGVDAVNFAQYVTSSQLPSFLSNLSNQGITNFSINPSGNRNVYVPTTYVGYISSVTLPAALGLDQLSTPVRAEAVNQALTSGNVTMSGKITSIAIHKGQPAFLIYKPVFKGPFETLAERQSSIYGFVYVAVDSNTFFNALLGNYINQDTAIQVYDGSIKTNNLLYQTPDFASRIKHISQPIYSTVNIFFGGRIWYIRVITARSIILAGSNQTALIELLTGIVISFIIASIIWYFTYYRDRKVFWQRQMEVQSAKDELLSLASHQLRTPATIVKQYLGVILQNYSGEITDQQRSIIQTAYDSNERQLEIANQFLSAARLDSGRIKLSSELISLNTILDEVVSEQQKIAKTRRQKIVFSNPKKKYKIEGDPKYLAMVFENILSNAIKYSKQSTEINVSIHKKGNNIEIIIIDQGMGISPEEQQGVFDKFTRASSDVNAGRNGTGIGLYLAKQIIDLHGGDIKVESALGKGLEVHCNITNGGLIIKISVGSKYLLSLEN